MNDQLNFYENKLKYEMDPSDLNAALNNKENLVVVDARKAEAWQKEHIPGAINLPHAQMNAETTKDWDRSKLYVTYCDGIGCNASTKGALNLTKLGFKVKELMGGLEWWKLDGYAVNGKDADGNQIGCSC
ncbi:MAG: rhodanese-like domain-containing protein [Prolixibacteraceae bacterium]